MNGNSRIREAVQNQKHSIPSPLHYHMQRPEVSLDIYLRAQRRLIGGEAMSRQRIYLDQRFWIYCRDANLNNSDSNPTKVELWSQLKKAVDNGLIWCPIFASIWCETMKQSPASRVATVAVIDQLSGGIAIRPGDERFIIEFSHWACTSVFGDKTLALACPPITSPFLMRVSS